MIPMISVIGYSDSGKTTLIEKLVPALKKMGFRVGAIKHSVHQSRFDVKGKDSWRFYEAGADAVVVSSADNIAVFKRKEENSGEKYSELPELMTYFNDMDIVIAEGYKKGNHPKIEVYRSGDNAPICEKDGRVFVLVSDLPVKTDIPVYGADEVEKLAELIKDRFLNNRGLLAE